MNQEIVELCSDELVGADLLQKIHDRTAVVGIVGLGYVGLPFAVEQAKAGYHVVGIDPDLQKVTRINKAENYVRDVDDNELRDMVNNGRIRAQNDFAGAGQCDIFVICVPTKLTKNRTPDLQYVVSAVKSIGSVLRRNQLVSLESTTYPGTTEEVTLPILERASGLKVERDFFLAYSAERVDPGNAKFKTHNTNKVVGGVGHASLGIAQAFYSQSIETMVPVSSAKAAELVKVFENTFRAVNIGLVNELAILCDRMDLNIWEILGAAFTKPFGIMPFWPGPGVGGHCVPLDPHYLEWKAKELNFNTRFITLAGEINRKMPQFTCEKAMRVLNTAGVTRSKSRVLVLGASYKKDLNDIRESPAIEVMHLLQKTGAHVDYHDPYVPSFNEMGVQLESVPLTADTLANYDLIVIATDHKAVDYNFVVQHAKAVLDTRNATAKVTLYRERITLL